MLRKDDKLIILSRLSLVFAVEMITYLKMGELLFLYSMAGIPDICLNFMYFFQAFDSLGL